MAKKIRTSSGTYRQGLDGHYHNSWTGRTIKNDPFSGPQRMWCGGLKVSRTYSSRRGGSVWGSSRSASFSTPRSTRCHESFASPALRYPSYAQMDPLAIVTAVFTVVSSALNFLFSIIGQSKKGRS